MTKLSGLYQLLSKSKTAIVGAIMLVVIVALASLAPLVAPYDPIDTSLRERFEPPSQKHWLGTDQLGRDILSRLLYGARISFLLGAGSVAIGGVLGVTAGLVVGYSGGWVDSLFMRIVDVLMAFPLLLMAITIMAILGPSLINTMIAIGLAVFAHFARLSRGEVLRVRDLDYIEAAKAAGAGSPRIVLRHVLPGIIGPVFVMATYRLGTAILAEAYLSFLGLGPPPPTPAWGLMVKEGLSNMRTAWWVSTIPGGAVMILVLAFNLVGDGLRDVLDPRLRHSA